MSSAAVLDGVDAAGGVITSLTQSHVRVGGVPWATAIASVASHGITPHDNAAIPSGTSHVRIDGRIALVAGDLATCGHFATGSGHVRA